MRKDTKIEIKMRFKQACIIIVIVSILAVAFNAVRVVTNEIKEAYKKEKAAESKLIVTCMKYDDTKKLMLALRDDFMGLDKNDQTILKELLGDRK